ncbi:MAG: S1 family peptidase [Polyangiaceae bacterium]
MRPRALLHLALLALVSCQNASASLAEHTRASRDAIINGAADDADPAIVMLAAWPSDLSSLDLCTATLVAPDALLTAAHCVDPSTHQGYGFGVYFGPDANAYPTASTLVPKLSPIASVHVHPDYDRDPPFTADLAIVLLPESVAIEPLPLGYSPVEASDVGAPARIVGYGQTKYEVPNAKKFSADTVLAGLDATDTITVGDLTHRTCIGDSGGPALMVRGGVETVIGVNSFTDLAGCLEPAHYRRTDLYADFLDLYVPRLSSGAGGAGGAAQGGGGASAGGAGGDTGAGGSSISDGGDESDGCSAGRARSTGLLPSLGLALGLTLSTRRRRRAPRT